MVVVFDLSILTRFDGPVSEGINRNRQSVSKNTNFDVFKTVNFQIVVFLLVTESSLVGGCRCFGGRCCLILQEGEESVGLYKQFCSSLVEKEMRKCHFLVSLKCRYPPTRLYSVTT
jgi:hypothetical protein